MGRPSLPQIAREAGARRRHDVSASLGAKGLSPWCHFLVACRTLRALRAFRNASAVRRPLGLPDDLVGEEGEAVTDGLGVEEAHGLLVAGFLEEALAGPERDRVDHQP